MSVSKAVAVVTGAASGLGLEACRLFTRKGMTVCMVDYSPSLATVMKDLEAELDQSDLYFYQADVSKSEEVLRLRDQILAEHQNVQILLNNAGIGQHCPPLPNQEQDMDQCIVNWTKSFAVNVWGVIWMSMAFGPHMLAQRTRSHIINVGSKQGITCPPGNAGYNSGKATVKAYTDALAHELRQSPYSQCTAHLFIPGYTWTPMNGEGTGRPKPDAAWTCEQTVSYLDERILENGDYLVLCPDNETTSAIDHARIEWSMGDMIHNRPALSRWHHDYKDQFASFLRARTGDHAA